MAVSCNETEWNKTNNEANKLVDVVIIPYPVKTVNNDTPYYNDFIEYNLTIVNNGTNKYTSILNVTDSLPVGLEFDDIIKVTGADFVVITGAVHKVVDGKDVYYLVDGQKVTWRITNITAKSNATITIRVKVVGIGDNIIRNSTFIANNVTNDPAVKYVGNLTNNLTVVGPNGTVKLVILVILGISVI